MTSYLTGLDSAVLLWKTYQQIYLLSWIQTSKTGGQQYSNASPYKVVVAQLAERSLPISEVCSSNPVCFEHINCKQMKIKKRPGKWVLSDHAIQMRDFFRCPFVLLKLKIAGFFDQSYKQSTIVNYDPICTLYKSRKLQ